MNNGFTFPCSLSKDVKNLIRKMLHKTPEKRIMIPEILDHPWVLSDDDFPLENSTEENTLSDLEDSNLLSNCSDNRKK